MKNPLNDPRAIAWDNYQALLDQVSDPIKRKIQKEHPDWDQYQVRIELNKKLAQLPEGTLPKQPNCFDYNRDEQEEIKRRLAQARTN